MSTGARIGLLVALLGALGAFAWFVAGGDEGASTAAAPTTWRSSVQCASCHADVWGEWLGSQHQIAYLNPEVRLLSDDFRNKECQACHLPRPVSVTGYGSRTLHRSILPDEGVSCLTCHLASDGGILGRNSVPDAPCRPRASAELVSVEMCASCHNQHQTTDQWRASTFAAAGTDCNDCHMQAVERTVAGGGKRAGHDHAYPASHDLAMLRQAVRFAAAVDGGELVLTVDNVGAGHSFPTEERSRAADLVVSFDGANGDGATWQQVYRFRLPYRNEPLPDTQLPAGATKVVRTPVPAGASAVTARLWYRLTPFVRDGEPRSALLFEQSIALGDGGPVVGALALPPAAPDSAFTKADHLAAGLRDAVARPADESVALALPPLPPLVLEARLPRFTALAAAGPPPPDESRLAELRDLLQTAFSGDGPNQRIAALAKRSLLEASDAAWGLELGLADASAFVRASAAYELGRTGRQGSIPKLLLRLKDEQDPTVVPWVAGALAALGNHAGLLSLAALMQQADTADLAGQRAIEVCRAAGVELADPPTYDELGQRLRELHQQWRDRGIVAGTAEPPPPEPLTSARLAAHLCHLEDFQLREVDEARFVLSRAGALALPLLREAVTAREQYLRTHALEILRDLGPAAGDAAAAVLPLCGDELSRVDAVRALGRMGARDAVPFLLPMLDAPDLELRAAAAEALGPIGDGGAAAALARLWRDERQLMDTRVMAAFSLALLAPGEGSRAWLEQRAAAGDYHRSTLDELLARIEASAQRAH